MEALGKRLMKRSPPASGDIKSLQELLLSFDEPLAIAVDRVRDRLGYEPTWADLFEKLANRVGRGIRYGEPPERWRDRVADPVSDAPGVTLSRSNFESLYTASYAVHESAVCLAHALADLIDLYEMHAPTVAPDDLADFAASITDGFAKMRSTIGCELGTPPEQGTLQPWPTSCSPTTAPRDSCSTRSGMRVMWMRCVHAS